MIYDLLIIGGGINGCGIARDAAGRGLKTVLVEMGDLAQGTSSASTKLIHGGLRYLEHYKFGLVREALNEREALLHIAPHIIRPMRFVLPHRPGMRAAWMLRLGLFIYDHLGGGRSLPATQMLDLRKHAAGRPLKPGFEKCFEYSDCWVDDARLVILNAMDAAARGADIRVRTRAVKAQRSGALWNVDVHTAEGATETLQARAIINAGGAWVDRIAQDVLAGLPAGRVRLVQGSHIVVPALFDHGHAYIFQNRDGRVVFAIPYEGAFTLIGTTDMDFKGDPAASAVSEHEIAYLLAAAGEYFATPPLTMDIKWSFSGVRALYDDGASAAKDATREYVLSLDDTGPPLLNVFGGKITTYRTLAEAALNRIAPFFPAMSRSSWTADAALPGGDLGEGGRPALIENMRAAFPWCDAAILARMVSSYGTMTRDILAGANSPEDMGRFFGAGLYEREIHWLIEREWARSADDILWRRSKLGLHMTPPQRDELARFMAQR